MVFEVMFEEVPEIASEIASEVVMKRLVGGFSKGKTDSIRGLMVLRRVVSVEARRLIIGSGVPWGV